MHEEDKKHIGHTSNVQFGKAIKVSRRLEPLLIWPTMVEESPFVTFIIQYNPEDTLRSLGVLPPIKKRRKAKRPSRHSKRLRKMNPTSPTGGDGDKESEDPPSLRTRDRSRRRLKQEPEDDQLQVHTRGQSQLPEPDEQGESLVALEGQENPWQDRTSAMASPIDPRESSSLRGAEQGQENLFGPPVGQDDLREPTLDYLDPLTIHGQAAAPPVDRLAPSYDVKRESPALPTQALSPSRAGYTQTETERMIKQEKMAHLDDLLAHLKEKPSVEDAMAYLRHRRDTVEKSLVKREPSPLRVPVRGEIIDLT
ncbi:hypothetical protein C8T65DRAFT_255073 [Cerioporus squamosus]|nr:hypothetical protein C8T65DRAFT_255073 [Cerioporus squamosus]